MLANSSMTAVHQQETAQTTASGLQWLYRAAGAAALVQLACTVMTMIVVFTIGVEPENAQAYFTLLQDDRVNGLLRMDFASLVNVALFSITAFAVYAALRRRVDVLPALGTALVYVGVALPIILHPGMSMLHLSDQYAAAGTTAQQSQLLAAGEAVIAMNWWNSTGGLLSGVFLQGGAVLLSLLMLRSGQFSKATAYTGMLANGLDWLHIFAGLFLPAFGTLLLSIGGLFYLAWYPLLGRDLLRLGREENRGQ